MVFFTTPPHYPKSFQHRRNRVERAAAFRRVRQLFVLLGSDDPGSSGAEDVAHFQGVNQRFDAVGVDLLQKIDVFNDGGASWRVITASSVSVSCNRAR